MAVRRGSKRPHERCKKGVDEVTCVLEFAATGGLGPRAGSDAASRPSKAGRPSSCWPTSTAESRGSPICWRIEVGEITLDGHVPVPPAPRFPPGLTYWEVRWVPNHVATETARHAGQADIIRESIDGKQAYELNDLADGIEVREWTASPE